MKTPERCHFDASEIRPFTREFYPGDNAAITQDAWDKAVCENHTDLSKLGIGISRSAARRMFQFSQDAIEEFAMDSTIQQGLTTPSITTPVQFLQNWLPGFIKVLTAARKIDDCIGMTTAGNWDDEEIVQGILENTGSAQPYGDYTNVPFASWNVNFVKRTVVRFEEGMRVGNLEEARAARIRVNSAESKRESAGLVLEIARNAVGFYGYNGGNNLTYGFLTDPNLPNYMTVADGVAGYTWSVKTFLEICKDIRAAVVQLRTQTQDQVDPEKIPLSLILPTDCVDYLSVVSDFGISVRDWMRQAYPKIRVVSAPQLNNANSSANVFYLFADRVEDLSSDDGRTWVQVVPAKFQVLGIQKMAKGYEEDYSNATAGVLLKRPYAVTRWTGI